MGKGHLAYIGDESDNTPLFDRDINAIDDKTNSIRWNTFHQLLGREVESPVAIDPHRF